MLLLALVTAVPVYAAAAYSADERPSPCGQDTVLDAVQRRLSRAGQLAVIEPGNAGQVPGGRPGIVSCAVRVHMAVYDTPRLGLAPEIVVQVYQYSLELRRNGIFLLP